MKNISVQELKQKLDAGQPFNLVDVREPDEHAAFNVGGLLLPLGKIQAMQTDDIDSLKDEEVILYCRSGNRSTQACLMLESMGFKNVTNVAGGMLDWQDKFEKK
ncbi:MAG: rhodanese-like domain-containing protein [Bacteroidetes bacterium]|nr:rhodanese-like domain-containing protein [Bacteroidota bacterium]MBS1756549.1 rhodanese-like domain-containing protein [Bacteroidota bacterium]